MAVTVPAQRADTGNSDTGEKALIGEKALYRIPEVMRLLSRDRRLFTAASRRAGLGTAVTPHQLRHAARPQPAGCGRVAG